MDAALRREQILATIDASRSGGTPVSASRLAAELGVSRQVIVGDVALLRAQGHDIIATARGYTCHSMPQLLEAGHFIGKVACRHDSGEMQAELYLMVDLGASVINVIIEHELYGEITGQLNLKTRDEIDQFMLQYESSDTKLLSELSDGVHLHTVACRNKAHFDQLCQELNSKGYLLAE